MASGGAPHEAKPCWRRSEWAIMRWRSTAHPLRSYGVAWLLQAASRTKSPCALCHSGVSGHVRYVELAQTLEAIEHEQARLGNLKKCYDLMF